MSFITLLTDLTKLIPLFDKIQQHVSIKLKPLNPAGRFIQICETHGVHRNQIPRVFNEFTLLDVQSDTELLKKLDNNALQRIAEFFNIRVEWLEGASDQIYPTYDFYKHPEEYKDFLVELNKHEFPLIAEVLMPSKTISGNEALIILEKMIGEIGGKPYYRYYLCNNWSYTYWKSRADLTACIAITYNQIGHIHGKVTCSKLISSLAKGEKILGTPQGKQLTISGKNKSAEELVLNPSTFLNGIRKELNNHGYRAALGRWLDYEAQGLMDSGCNPPETRSLFLKKLFEISGSQNS